MNRLAAYGVVLAGVPVGYAGSYFAQSGAARMSLVEYVAISPMVLLPGAFGQIASADSVKGMYITAVAGMLAGVALFGAAAFTMATSGPASQSVSISRVAIAVAIAVFLLFGTVVIGHKRQLDRNVEKVASSDWWKNQPSKQRISELIHSIASETEGTFVFIDATGRYMADHPRKVGGITDKMFWRQRSSGMDSRRLLIEMSGRKRPTLDEASAILLSAVEAAEFRDGPGR